MVVDVKEQLKVDVMDKNLNNITEGMFSTIDQIRQDSKDVRDFVKNVFADREFKKMSKDKEFIKYLKSIYEGTILDEEQIKFSNRINSGTIVTTITNEDTLNEISRLSMGIAGLTGTRGSAVEKFIKDYNLNDKELFKFLKKGKLKDRLDFATALSGRPGNKYQGDFVGAFGEGVEESVNEASMDWEKNFKWANDKELKVISKFIFMNDRGIDGVIKMSKHKPFAFRRTIQKMAKKGLHEAKVETERYFGKKGIIIMIRDGNKLVSAIFKNSKNADKFNRNNPSDVKKLLQLAKKTKYPKAIDESKKNEASTINKQRAGAELKQKLKGKRSDGLGKYTATIYGLDSKGKRVELKSLNDLNKYPKFEIDESVNEAKFGYKDSTASYITKHKNEFKLAKKLNKGNELKFYDELEKLESKLRRPKYMVFLSNALRGFKVDMYKDSKIKNKQEAEEALFLLSK